MYFMYNTQRCSKDQGGYFNSLILQAFDLPPLVSDQNQYNVPACLRAICAPFWTIYSCFIAMSSQI